VWKVREGEQQPYVAVGRRERESESWVRGGSENYWLRLLLAEEITG